MPDAAYRIARRVATRLLADNQLAPPFDIGKLAGRFALVLEEELPTSADVIVVHSTVPGEKPRIVVDAAAAGDDARRRFAIAHALGHVLLGWHPLGAPCDVATAPHELPVTVHDLVEGEANAFARELLAPAAWIASFDAFDRPAQLMVHVSERAGIPVMAAARAVALQLAPGHVWVVSDRWGRVLDAGRSPRTPYCVPARNEEFDSAGYARHAAERQKLDLDGAHLWVWHFDDTAREHLPHDQTPREVAASIAADLGLGESGAAELAARVDGIAGWANEQLGTASLDGMTRVLGDRARSIPELATIATHPAFGTLMRVKATELVAKRLAR